MKSIAREGAEVKPFKSMMGIAVTCLSMAATGTTLAATDSARNSAPAPLLIKHSTDLGAVDPSSTIEITMWLKLRDEKALDNALTAQRENGAPYLSSAQIDSQLAPTAASVADVSRFLTSRGLNVTGVGPHNLFVKASGSVALIQSTLGVDVHQYQIRKDMTFRAKHERRDDTGGTCADRAIGQRAQRSCTAADHCARRHGVAQQAQYCARSGCGRLARPTDEDFSGRRQRRAGLCGAVLPAADQQEFQRRRRQCHLLRQSLRHRTSATRPPAPVAPCGFISRATLRPRTT